MSLRIRLPKSCACRLDEDLATSVKLRNRNGMVVYNGCDMITLSLHGMHVLEFQNIYHCIIKFAYFEPLGITSTAYFQDVLEKPY